MPFLRFSRDKRGYEHTYLVHAANRRGRPTRPRVLYWYRTPPGVRVGRAPFDAEMRKMLEAQYPGVAFDWKTFQSTPVPPPEPEYWRERRRAERAAKQARQLEESAAEESETPNDAADEAAELPMPLGSAQAAEGAVEFTVSLETAGSDGSTSGFERRIGASGPNPNQLERRRSRRGGRRRRARMALAQGGDKDHSPSGAPAAAQTAAAPAAGEGASGKLDEALGTAANPGESGQE